MKLNKHVDEIVNCKTWQKLRPPKKPDIQWQDGRSAKELAKYITKDLPSMPLEIEDILKLFVDEDATYGKSWGILKYFTKNKPFRRPLSNSSVRGTIIPKEVFR